MKTRHAGTDPVVQLDHVKGRQFRWYNVFMILLMSLGSFGYAMSAAIIGTTLAQPFFLEYFGLAARSNGLQLIAATNGLYYAGGIFGCFATTPIADRWGRKLAIGVAATIVLISGAFLAGSVHIGMFIAFRFVNGFGAAQLLIMVPVYMAEISPPSVRGVMVVMHGVAIGFGYTLAQWIGYGFFHVHSNISWRMPLSFQCYPLAILLGVLPWIPESPRFLVLRDRAEDAEEILKKLHNPEEAAIELVQINHQVTLESSLPSGWIDMIKKPSYRKRALMGLVLASSTQMVGTLVINNYGPTIFAGLGFDEDKTFLLQASSVTAGFIASPGAMYIVDRFPRNKLLGGFEFGCIATVIVEAALAATMVPQQNVAGLRAAAAMIFLFFMLFNLGVDCSVYAYLSEIFPTHLRAKGMALAVAGINITDLILLQVAPTAFANIGWKFYLCFIFPALVMASMIFFLFPDTWGVPLEEISAIFGDIDELYHYTADEIARDTPIVEKENLRPSTNEVEEGA